MAVDKAKQFLKEYRSNEEAVKILEQAPQPKSEDEAIARLVETAGKLGTRNTEEECFWHDACETANVRYYDCEGKWHPNRGEYDCKVLHYFCDKYWECDHTGIFG